jgi:hypothetical protein
MVGTAKRLAASMVGTPEARRLKPRPDVRAQRA